MAKNLIGIFLNTRAVGRLPRIQGIEPAKIKKATMLGGGVTGSGIVNLLLSAGIDTTLWDINQEALNKGVASVRKTFEYAVKNKKMGQADLNALIEKKLKTTTSSEDAKDSDLIVEVVLEDMKVKQEVWEKTRRPLPTRNHIRH